MNKHEAEVAALIRWKEEATAVIGSWERVWTLLGEPGSIGESKSEATWVEVHDLLDARGELVEAKRARREADRDRNFTIAMANALMVERDAARARVTELSNEVIDLRAEVAALREQMDALLSDEATWGHNIRHEVLAALRDRVKALAGLSYVSGHTTVWLHEVLAMIDDEAQS